jgi:uncharacterized membrane protein YhaH (DUF805 family)
MYEMLHLLCLALFLALPPALLIVRFRNNKPGWWLLLTMIMMLGWFFVFASFVFYHEHIGDLIAQNHELPEDWDGDGASGAATLFFGWLISLIYSLPWLAMYVFIAGIRRWGQNHGSPGNDI